MGLFSLTSSTSRAEKHMREAEDKLLRYAHTFGTRDRSSYSLSSFDTEIPWSDLPLCDTSSSSSFAACSSCSQDTTISSTGEASEEQVPQRHLKMHALRAASSTVFDDTNKTDVPLVLIHGYMNGCGYFFRNIVGLTEYYETVYSVDLLGWGLSSRPSYQELRDSSLETAEDFFVASLECWRKQNQIDTMVLSGHSFGGYVATAYCERYPEHVDRLILLSPMGVPDDQDPTFLARKEKISSSYGGWMAMKFFQHFCYGTATLGAMLRKLPECKGLKLALDYVTNRLPEISDPDERQAVADYLYWNNRLPGSGEYCVAHLFHPTLLAKKPLQDRIPQLKVGKVALIYGASDWMETSAGLSAQRNCFHRRRKLTEQSGATMSEIAKDSPPECKVLVVRDAGHLLILQNWHLTNAVLIHSHGGTVAEGQLPMSLRAGEKKIPDVELRKLFPSNLGGSQEIQV